MTVFFDINKLEKSAGTDSQYLLNLLAFHYYNGAHRSRFIKKADLYKNFSGKNWILNPEPLFLDRSTDPIFLAQYVKLAARRSYTMYKLYSFKYLDLSFYPEISISAIKYNPLLIIQQNKVYFKHEGN